MAHHGAVLERSLGTLHVVGYYYPDGEHGKREQMYRVPVAAGDYSRAVRQIKRAGGTNEQKDCKLYNAFVPKHKGVPADFAVQPLKDGEEPKGKTTCGHCGLSWDDDKQTGWTPVPSGRCPFEYFHMYPEDK